MKININGKSYLVETENDLIELMKKFGFLEGKN